MPEVLTLQAILKLKGQVENAADLTTPIDPIDKDYTINFTNGTGANQGNMIFHDQRTLTASATENLDLAGVLTSKFGTTITFMAVKGILVVAAAANTNNVNVSREGTNGVPVFLALGDGLPVKPGGVFLWIDPTAAGVAVTAGTGDLLTVANSAGGTSVVYDVWIWGEI